MDKLASLTNTVKTRDEEKSSPLYQYVYSTIHTHLHTYILYIQYIHGMNAYYVYTIADWHGVFGSKTVVPQQLGAQPI
jgi:hypothetical protein